ncbi:hypothetical protein KUC42_08540 [Pseudomonas aeruginosa]|uniref:hypothetical protein n=1 Tax=Pseudomonas aeruginosa TaxID=287 RepID=UPI0021E31CCA|nr:hypothetical protein [Pseudomonas aeruginosa]MCV0108788.1 hypothetical protein [Pseudomonas aeruginosa]MCV0113084.1 hypothetical protein [Pseudomonas aeruginosa]
MSIDWSKAPEGCIGAFARIISKTAFFVFSKRPSDYSSREGYEGVGEDGPYHVFSEYWEWIDKPWDGQGLPPVGITCESWRSGVRRIVKILGHGDEYIFVREDDGREILLSIGDGREFRPLRTPEQIAAEEREKAIEEMFFAEETLTVKQAKALYEAGYRRQESST